MAASLKKIHVVLMGPIASGKGTLASIILKTFPDFVQISPGDALRKEIEKNTALGQAAKEYIAKGSLVPDELIVNTMLDKIDQASSKHWILDGFPRTVSQAKILHGTESFGENSIEINCDAKGLVRNPINVVLNLIVPEETILERIANRWTHIPSGRVYNVGFREPKVRWKDDVTGEDLVQREDDKPAVVCERLKIYENLTKPVLEFYRYHEITILDLESENTDDIWKIVQRFLNEEMQKLKSAKK